MTPICFIDTETTGLGPNSEPWEVAIIRRDDRGETEHHYLVAARDLDLVAADRYALELGGFYRRHPDGQRLSTGITDPTTAYRVAGSIVAEDVAQLTHGAYLVGVNVAYDVDVLGRFLRGYGVLPAWDYHLGDLYGLSVGWLNAQAAVPPLRYVTGIDLATPSADFEPSRIWTIPDSAEYGVLTPGADLITPPWPKSDELAARCGVTPPADDERHTAMGDARWAARWWDAITPTTPARPQTSEEPTRA